MTLRQALGGDARRIHELLDRRLDREDSPSCADEVRAVGRVMLPTAIVAALLVLYFDWRGKLRRRILAERDAQRDGRVVLDEAA